MCAPFHLDRLMRYARFYNVRIYFMYSDRGAQNKCYTPCFILWFFYICSPAGLYKNYGGYSKENEFFLLAHPFKKKKNIHRGSISLVNYETIK